MSIDLGCVCWSRETRGRRQPTRLVHQPQLFHHLKTTYFWDGTYLAISSFGISVNLLGEKIWPVGGFYLRQATLILRYSDLQSIYDHVLSSAPLIHFKLFAFFSFMMMGLFCPFLWRE